MPPVLAGAPAPHPFKADSSGAFSRTILVAEESPDFRLSIRDFSFPPDRRTHTIVLPAAAFIHRLSGTGVINISNQRLVLTPRARTAVPPRAPIKVKNSGDQPVVLRALIVEAK
ncbi:MAG: hypothetical protein L0Y57_09515 [Beijerinckiaceae bacterium]|nr:hypothetical protein [Beijerinckiaceae bacterium]MCI0735551.1 hypothetical protein [Beijerinckiaceae bacterium]